MAQTLDLAAPDLGIGLCHIGDLEFAAIRSHFQLGEDHCWVLSLLGGAQPEKDPAPETAALDRLVSRVADLTPDQVQSLLAAKRGAAERKS